MRTSLGMMGYCAPMSSPCSSLYSAKRLRRPAQAMGLGERFEMATHVVTLRAVQVDVMVKVTVFSKGFPFFFIDDDVRCRSIGKCLYLAKIEIDCQII
jgi:hypothetical protein